MAIKLPSILDIPDKLLPLIERFNDYRYFLIEGGRASGKSQTIARFLSYLCEQKHIRVVCGRETQNTIEESVYTVFADLIRQFNLNFGVGASKIDHNVTKSAIRFRGFREQGATNIKGLEGVDVLWVEEAQAISKQTLDVIIPTIRKNNSKIIWSMNRHVENDPVFVAMKGRSDCLHIHIDYHENNFCPQKMVDEANLCKARDLDDYNHIWLGQPLSKGDDFLFVAKDIYHSAESKFDVVGTQKRILAVDVARFGDDETVFTIVESADIIRWNQLYMYSWRGKPTTETAGKSLAIAREFNVDMIVIDDTGVGGGVTDMIGETKRYTVSAFNGGNKARNPKYVNARSEGFFDLKEMFDKDNLRILPDSLLAEQLMSIRYKFMRNEQKMIVSKDDMRKEGLKSPDRCDALMMALYYKDVVMSPRLSSNMPRYTVDTRPLMGIPRQTVG